MENVEKSFIIRRLMTYGAIIGVAVVLLYLIAYKTGTNLITDTSNSFIAQLPMFIIIIGIYFSLRNLGATIQKRLNFGQFILFGGLIGVFYGIIFSAFVVVFFIKIAPETFKIFDGMLEMLNKMNFPQDIVESEMKMIKQPVFIFISYWFAAAIQSFIISFFFALLNLILPKPPKQ